MLGETHGGGDRRVENVTGKTFRQQEDYLDVIPTSQEDLVRFVRLERRLELCGGRDIVGLICGVMLFTPTFPEEKEIVHESVKNGTKVGYYRACPLF